MGVSSDDEAGLQLVDKSSETSLMDESPGGLDDTFSGDAIGLEWNGAAVDLDKVSCFLAKRFHFDIAPWICTIDSVPLVRDVESPEASNCHRCLLWRGE